MFDLSIRVVASLFRRFFVSLRYFVPSSRPPIRPVVSSPRWLRSLVCHSSRCFASLMFPFVVSLRLFDRASLWTRIGIIRPWINEVVDLLGNMANLLRDEEIENLPPPEGTVYFQPRTRTVRWEWEWSELSHYTFWQSDMYSFTSFFLILRSHRVGKFVAESSWNNCCR